MTIGQYLACGFIVLLVVIVVRGALGHRPRYRDDNDGWQAEGQGERGGGESGGGGD